MTASLTPSSTAAPGSSAPPPPYSEADMYLSGQHQHLSNRQGNPEKEKVAPANLPSKDHSHYSSPSSSSSSCSSSSSSSSQLLQRLHHRLLLDDMKERETSHNSTTTTTAITIPHFHRPVELLNNNNNHNNNIHHFQHPPASLSIYSGFNNISPSGRNQERHAIKDEQHITTTHHGTSLPPSRLNAASHSSAHPTHAQQPKQSTHMIQSPSAHDYSSLSTLPALPPAPSFYTAFLASLFSRQTQEPPSPPGYASSSSSPSSIPSTQDLTSNKRSPISSPRSSSSSSSSEVLPSSQRRLSYNSSPTSDPVVICDVAPSSKKRKRDDPPCKTVNKEPKKNQGSEEEDDDEQNDHTDESGKMWYCQFKKRTRKLKDASQLNILEKEFINDPIPSRKTKQRLASQLGMTVKTIQVWFQVTFNNNNHTKVKDLKSQISLFPFFYRTVEPKKRRYNRCRCTTRPTIRPRSLTHWPFLYKELKMHWHTPRRATLSLTHTTPAGLLQSDEVRTGQDRTKGCTYIHTYIYFILQRAVWGSVGPIIALLLGCHQTNPK